MLLVLPQPEAKSKYFGYYGNITGDFTLSGATNTNLTNGRFILGAARVQKLTPKKMFFYSLAYESVTLSKSGATDEKTAVTRAPLKIGFEYTAKDWLVLRGAVSQNIFVNDVVSDNGVVSVKDTIDDSARTSAGMSIIMDDLTLDGSLITTTGIISFNQIMSRVSMNYKF